MSQSCWNVGVGVGFLRGVRLVRRVGIETQQTFIDAERLRDVGIELERDVALAPYTTIKIGGPADYFAVVTSLEQLTTLVRWAQSVELPYFLLGGGSNMLISDAGIRGLTIYNRCRRVEFVETPPENDAVPQTILYAESGAAMAGAARLSANRGLAGMEWAVSLPGTVGGAVVGNAGAYGAEVKDNLIDIRLMSERGDVASMTVHDMAYGYRTSALKRLRPLQAGFKPVVLDARFRLNSEDAAAVRARADQYLAHRRSTQPVEPSLGSTFMNPPGDYAGRLIEAAGLKGRQVNGVGISDVHANFIVNLKGVGGATAGDVMNLVRMVQSTVLSKFGVELVPEIQLAGDWHGQ